MVVCGLLQHVHAEWQQRQWRHQRQRGIGDSHSPGFARQCASAIGRDSATDSNPDGYEQDDSGLEGEQGKHFNGGLVYGSIGNVADSSYDYRDQPGILHRFRISYDHGLSGCYVREFGDHDLFPTPGNSRRHVQCGTNRIGRHPALPLVCERIPGGAVGQLDREYHWNTNPRRCLSGPDSSYRFALEHGNLAGDDGCDLQHHILRL